MKYGEAKVQDIVGEYTMEYHIDYWDQDLETMIKFPVLEIDRVIYKNRKGTFEIPLDSLREDTFNHLSSQMKNG